VLAHQHLAEAAQRLAGVQALQHLARDAAPCTSWPEELDRTLGRDGARLRLGGIVEERGPAQRPALVDGRVDRHRKRLAQRLHGGLGEVVVGVVGDVGGRVDDVHRVLEDVEVVVEVLVDALEAGHLRQHHRQHAEAVGQLERVGRVAQPRGCG
jgi:hypothetical protein